MAEKGKKGTGELTNGAAQPRLFFVSFVLFLEQRRLVSEGRQKKGPVN